MIEFVGVEYAYPNAQKLALSRVSVQIEPGEAVLLVGRSGSGKSTFLGVVNGLIPHFYGGRFRGEAWIAGHETRGVSPLELSEKVGMVFQELQSRFVTGSVLDEIAFGMELAAMPAPDIQRQLDDLVERLQLGPLLGRPIDRLSAGEQQRVAVAAALARRPRILLLDEPASQLDPAVAESVFSWVDDLRRQFGLTILIAEHRIERVLGRAERALHLAGNGRLVHDGPLHEVIHHLPFASPLHEAARRLGLEGELLTSVLADRLREGFIAHEAQGAENKTSAGGGRLRAKGLCASNNGQPALRGVDLEIREGEVLAIVGRNGAGKSTLLRCLMRLMPLEAGEVWLDGQETRGWPVVEVALRVAYVPQWPSSLLFAESVRDELQVTLSNHGLAQRPPVDPEELLARLGLQGVAEAYPRDLSAGERQRTALAAQLVTRPSVVLLEEPTLGMDPLAQADLGALLRQMRAEGTAVAFATHDAEFAAAHAERVVVLEAGTVVAEGATAETLFARPDLRTALQRVTGRPWPASAKDVAWLGMTQGEGHADD